MPIGINRDPENTGGCQNPLDAAVNGVKELRKEVEALKEKLADLENKSTKPSEKKPAHLPEHKAVNFETK